MHKLIIVFILFVGIIFRLFITSNGNFIFNMDNGRDMVDVREMIILKKLRLTGPNTPIEGVYDGPGWYYLLAIPFILSSGHPYGSIIMQIVLWAIGGFYLLKLTSRWGVISMLTAGSLWVASNFIVLAGLYAFNPSPVMFLSPLLIFLIEKYIKSGNLIYGILMWLLAGLFFNFEMNFGIFTPVIIISSIIFGNRISILKQTSFWIGVSFFLLCLLPQIIFDIKHQNIITKGLITHIQNAKGDFNLLNRFYELAHSFYQVLVPTLLNVKFISSFFIFLFAYIFIKFFRKEKKDLIVTISLLFLLVPFISYLFLPVAVNPWHLGAEMAAILILIGFMLKELMQMKFWGKILAFAFSVLIIAFSIKNIANFFIYDIKKPNMDPSVFKNEIAAIDFAYKYANGKNFKVYTYIPSIYDYPYQYLIWWHGLKEYGYLPTDYAYSPDKPPYIPSKVSFSASEDQLKLREDSNLVFLIKEPNRNYTRFGWEGDFAIYKWETVEKVMVGPIEIEVRKATKQ